jgi:ribosome-associated toxin RatA of RatAB toxin-antitoxin module
VPTFEAERYIEAPRERTWGVVSDAANLANHAPNLSETEVLGGTGKGMVRRCYNNRGSGWNETCTLWRPGHRYTMEVDTSDYPYPLTQMRGTWEVRDQGEGTLLRLRYDYEMKYGPLGSVLAVLMRPAFARTCRKMLDNYERDALGAPAPA